MVIDLSGLFNIIIYSIFGLLLGSITLLLLAGLPAAVIFLVLVS